MTALRKTEATDPRQCGRWRISYLYLLVVIPAVVTFGHYLSPQQPVLAGQDLGIVAGGIALLIAIGVWFTCASQGTWSLLVRFFFVLLLVTWLYQILRMRADSMGFNYTAFIVPVAVILILLKRTRAFVLNKALLILGSSLAFIALASFIFGSFGLVPNGFDASDAGGPPRYSWLEWLGVESRWGGPWGSVNRASAMGGIVVLIGALQRGWSRIALMFIGIAAVLLGGSRAALIAAFVGLFVIILFHERIRRSGHARAIQLSAVGILVVSVVGYIVVFDPSLALRTPIWKYFLDLVPRSGLFGVGDSGVNEYVSFLSANDPDFLAHTDPHNIFFDWLVRYGWVMIALSLVILGMTAFVAIKALLKGAAAPAALLAYVVIYGSADTIVSWIYWTPFLIVVIWSFLFATSVRGESHAASTADATVNRQ